MINPYFLTDENAAFVQRLEAEKGLQAVGIKTDTKNCVIFYQNGMNVEVEHENLESIEYLGGRKVYKVVGIGEQIVFPPNEYRNAKLNAKILQK